MAIAAAILVLALGAAYKPTHHFDVGHAHNLYLGALAERGLVGFVPLLAVLLAWLVSLARRLPQARADADAWLFWGSAAGAWVVTTAVGFADTTLHSEHGILAMLLLGVWLRHQARSQAAVRASPSSGA